MSIDLNEVRDYLLQTNSIEEAECILLDNVLSKSNEKLKRKVAEETFLEKKDTNIVEEKLDPMKIYDLLGTYEKVIKEKEAERKVAPINSFPSDFQSEQFDKLKLLEKVGIHELSELERRKEWMELKLLANKQEIRKQEVIQNLPRSSVETLAELKAKQVIIPLSSKTKENMDRLYELTEEHARKLAENRAEALSYQRELEQLKKGNWSMDTSNLTKPPRPKGTKTATTTDNVTVDNVHKNSNSSISTDIMSANKADTLLSSYLNKDALTLQKQEIALLREQASLSRSNAQSDELINNITSTIHKNVDYRLQSRYGHGNNNDDSGDINESGYVSRRMSVPDYLEQWLQVGDSSTNVAADVQLQATNENNVLLLNKKDSNNNNSSSILQKSGLAGIKRSTSLLDSNKQPYTDNNKSSSSGYEDPMKIIEQLREENKRLLEDNNNNNSSNRNKRVENRKEVSIITTTEANNNDDEMTTQYPIYRTPKQPIQQSPYYPQPIRFPQQQQPPAAAIRLVNGLNNFRNYPQQQLQLHANPYNNSLDHYNNIGMQPPVYSNGISNNYPYYHHQQQQQQPPLAMQQQQYHSQLYPQQPITSYQLQQQQQQQAMWMQMQKMAEQLETENMRLLGQVGGEQHNNNMLSVAVGGGGAADGNTDPATAASMMTGGNNNNQMSNLVTADGGNKMSYPQLERDRQVANGSVGTSVAGIGGGRPTREDIHHQQTIRRMQHEMERIRCQKELDTTIAEYEEQKAQRKKAAEHEQWLEQQKQELKEVKMQQVLAKEKRLLQLQQQEESGNGNNGSNSNDGSASSSSLSSNAAAVLREESGIGRVVCNLPLDVVSGITIIVDGVIIPRRSQVGQVFRIALGLYDKSGKTLARVTASDWQNWIRKEEQQQQPSAVAAGGGGGGLQPLKSLIMRTLKLSDFVNNSNSSSSDSSNGLNALEHARCMIEIQTKEEGKREHTWIGWGAVPIVIGNTNTNMNGQASSSSSLVVCNNAWRSAVRKGISDPAVDASLLMAKLPSKTANTSITAAAIAAAEFVSNAWVLVRIIDTNDLQRATSWTLAGGNSHSGSIISTEVDALDFYTDPLAFRNNNNNDNFNTMDGKNPLNNMSFSSINSNSFYEQRKPDFGRNSNVGNNSTSKTSKGQRLGGFNSMSRDEEEEEYNNNNMNYSNRDENGQSLRAPPIGMLRNKVAFQSKRNLDVGGDNTISTPMSILKPPSSSSSSNREAISHSPSLPLLQPPSSASRKVTSADKDNTSNSSSSIGTPTTAAAAVVSASSKKGFFALTKVAEEDESSPRATNEDTSSSVTVEEKSYWYLGSPLGPCTDRYQRGDGVDVYIDSAMFLPDNCTVCRVAMRLFTANKEQVGAAVYEGIALPYSPSMAPVFKLKAELRASAFNTTATALIRIDTIDAVSLLPVSVGYSCVKIFSTRDRAQPKSAAEPNVYVNTGHYQLPIRAGRLSSTLAIFDDTMLQGIPRIPCASLLVRVLPAPKSSDGITTLSRDEFPPEDWVRLGLEIPAPLYASGAYNGALCEPLDAAELTCYKTKSQSVPESIESAILQAMSVQPNAAARWPSKPPSNSSGGGGNIGSTSSAVSEMTEWIRAILPAHNEMKRSIDYSYAVPYHVDTGISVSLERLYNMPDTTNKISLSTPPSTMYKIICSVAPPGLFYKDPPLFDGVYYTKSQQLDSNMRAPIFSEGYYDFYPPHMDANLFLVIDVRVIHISKGKNNGDNSNDTSISSEVIVVEPPVSSSSNSTTPNCYWSLLPLSMEKVPGQGYRYAQSGVFHLPLFEGPVPSDTIFKSMNPYRELLSRLASKNKTNVGYNMKVLDGGMIVVKVLNPLLRELVVGEIESPKPIIQTVFMEGLLDAAVTGMSGSNARRDKFILDPGRYPSGGEKTTTAAQLPKSSANHLPALMKAINKAFENATGIPASL